jgi:concanavalin A-like lectin/glucanase superfamily protein
LVARHRKDGETEIIPAITAAPAEAVSEAAPSEPAPRRRLVYYVLSGAAAVFVLASTVAWVLTEPRLPAPIPAAPTSNKGNQAIEGFGEPSPGTSPSARPGSRGSASPSPSPASGATALAPSAPSAAAHYRLDESSGTTVSDASGHGKTASLQGGAAFAAGRLGNGVNLSGTSQYIALPTGILSGATGFTVSAWIRLDTVATWSRVFDFGTGTNVNMFLTPRSSGGTARFAITTGGNGGEQRINGPAALPSGTWTHVAVTLSGGTGILYVNRAEVARTTGMTLTPASLGSTGNNWIGRSQYPADPYLDGVVDDVRVYAHALSAGEIAALP